MFVVGVLAACGGNDPAVTKEAGSATTSTTVAPEATGGEAVRAYFEAFATSDPQKMRAGMLPVSAPGSAAALYAIHQAAFAEAQIAGGIPVAEDSVKFSTDKVETCTKNPLTQEETCGGFTNFVVNEAGLLSDFDSSGKTISARLGASDASETLAVGATVRFVSAYRTGQSDDLSVVLEVTSGLTETTVLISSASYVGADGKQVNAAYSAGPYELKPGAKAYYATSFPGADLGGVVSVDVQDAEYNSGTATFPIKPAP